MNSTDVFGVSIGFSTDTIHNNQTYFRIIVGGGGGLVLLTYFMAFARGYQQGSYKFLWGPLDEYKNALRGFTVSAILAALSLTFVMVVIAFGDVIKPSTEIIISFALMELGAAMWYPSLSCAMGVLSDPKPGITALPIVLTLIGNIFVVMALIFNIDNDNKEWTAICASLASLAVTHHLVWDLIIWMLGYRQELPDFYAKDDDTESKTTLLENGGSKIRMRFT